MNTILIVDDDATARETLISMLESEDYDLIVAKNGPEALQKAESMQPDLILLDVMMPGMDGFDVCHRIRSKPHLAEVPIIILTALDDRESLLRGIETGADDFLTKPVDRHELRARVRTIIRLNRYRTLMEQRENIRFMAERVVSTQENERRRISRDLHDDLGQALTTHLLAMNELREESSLPAALRDRVNALYDQTHAISVKLRELAQDLRPPVLDTLGLSSAIQTYCAEFSRRSKLEVEVEVDEGIPTLPDMYTITLYRVLQEALTNVLKHAQASHVWVDLTREGNTVTLTVQDNGCGFDKKANDSKGLGLTGLNERVTIAGGRFKVSSSTVRGTIIMSQLPLPDAELVKDDA